jgi:hypothetical protein
MTEISIAEAKKLAEEAAHSNLKGLLTGFDGNILREEFAEGENCWFFFRNPSIDVPPQMSLTGECAYAVSRRGEVREIADFSESPERLSEYLKVMSDYFARKEV